MPKASPKFRAQTTGDIALMVLQNVGVVQVAWTSGHGLEPRWTRLSWWVVSCLVAFGFIEILALDIVLDPNRALPPKQPGENRWLFTLFGSKMPSKKDVLKTSQPKRNDRNS